MTQGSKKFKKIINQVFASVNNVMRMCNEDVAIASMDEQIYTYSFGDKYVVVTAWVSLDVPQFTIASLDSGRVKGIDVYSAGEGECAYIYTVICSELGVYKQNKFVNQFVHDFMCCHS